MHLVNNIIYVLSWIAGDSSAVVVAVYEVHSLIHDFFSN